MIRDDDKLLDPDMPAQQLRLHMGEMTAQEMRTARAAIRWANMRASRLPRQDDEIRKAALEQAGPVANFCPCELSPDYAGVAMCSRCVGPHQSPRPSTDAPPRALSQKGDEADG